MKKAKERNQQKLKIKAVKECTFQIDLSLKNCISVQKNRFIKAKMPISKYF